MPQAVINAATNGDNQIIAGVAGKTIRVLNYIMVGDAQVHATWKSGTAGATTGSLSGPMATGGQGGGVSAPGAAEPWFDTLNVGDGLVLTLDAAVTVGGHIRYVLN